MRFAGDDAGREELVLLDAALEAGRAVTCAGRVVVPLLDGRGACLGYLVADRGGAPLELADADLHLLSTLGAVGGVLLAKAAEREELERALEELRRADELKAEFVSIASHELRAPIAVVCGITATLQRRAGELAPRQADELRAALYDQTVRLNDLTEQLLDLSRVDAGRVRVEPRAFKPRAAVDELVRRLADEPAIDVAIDPGCEVVADPVAFERVVENLLTNAVKYGRAPIAVRGDCDRLVVEDSGPGVAADFVPHLFERFTRAGGVPRSVAGAGLGLAIARAFATARGRRADVRAGRALRLAFRVRVQARGSSTVNVEPRRPSETTQMRPCMRCTSSLQM